MSLFKLPTELISHSAFYLLAQNPLGPPQHLITLALTCRSLHSIVTSNQFLAKLCRLKFDIASIKRRCFIPRDRDLADELIRCCRFIQEIRKADMSEVDSTIDDTLWGAYLLMLGNDGKNYAQLEYAGLDAFLDRLVRHRLWEGRENNQGWPLDNIINSLALWLMWMTLTKRKLAAESPAAREQMILLTLPYVVLPHRYPSASAPPNHFNLPLDNQNPYHQKPLVTTLSPSTPYPVYIQNGAFNVHYFNARVPISSPLITIAAKLLFVARKEIFPVRAPPHLPQGPGVDVVGITQEDYREFNKSPGARLCRVVSWDWDNGRPRRVDRASDEEEVGEDWEESKVWDTEWWRRLLCGDCRSDPGPTYLPGDVYKLGSMRGSWHGKEYLPAGNLFVHFLRHPNIPYPGIPDEHRPHLFTESSIGLSMKPVFFDVQEHHKICECPRESSSQYNDSHPYVDGTASFTSNANAGVASSSTSSTLSIVSEGGRCGVVPVPAPLIFVSTRQPTADHEVHDHAHANADEDEEDENIDVDATTNDPQPQPSDALSLSLPTPPSEINIIDYSMSNAWFPGHIGGVSFTKLPSVSTTTAGATARSEPKRDKIICAVDFQAPDVRNVLTKPEESECLALGGTTGGRRLQGQREKMNAYVYETYDPEKRSMHRGLDSSGDSGFDSTTNAFTSTSSSHHDAHTSDPHKCQRCIQREALIRQERKKAEERSKRMLDRGIRSYGRVGASWDDMDDMDEEGDEDDEDEDEGMQDLDVTGFDINLEGIEQAIAEATSSTPDDTQENTHPPRLMIFGDDHPYGQPGSYSDDPSDAIIEPTRRLYDKCRIGVECMGVGDVLLNGETGPRHAVWPQYTMYGRVRPWDGLIGILRTAHATGDTSIYNMIFIFGYIVGENNFVGEWRLAASNPLRPTWGSAFVMSRKVDEGRGGGGQTAQSAVSSGST